MGEIYSEQIYAPSYARAQVSGDERLGNCVEVGVRRWLRGLAATLSATLASLGHGFQISNRNRRAIWAQITNGEFVECSKRTAMRAS